MRTDNHPINIAAREAYPDLFRIIAAKLTSAINQLDNQTKRTLIEQEFLRATPTEYDVHLVTSDDNFNINHILIKNLGFILDDMSALTAYHNGKSTIILNHKEYGDVVGIRLKFESGFGTSIKLDSRPMQAMKKVLL